MNRAAVTASSLLALLTFSSAWAAPENSASVLGTSSAEVPVEKSPEAGTSLLKFKPSAAFTVGSTTNATLLTTPTPGTFGKVTPAMTVDYAPSDSLFVSGTLEGSVKRFADTLVGPLANESRASAKADVAWNPNEFWEVGTNLSFNYLQNHIPVVGASDSVEAIPQQYYQPEARIYGAWIGENWSFEAGTAGTTRRYDTTMFDIQGNVYHNTYNEFRFDGKTGYHWSKDLKLSLRSTIEQRSYQERMAEFSDGLPAFPGTANPLLSVLAQDDELQLKATVSSVVLSPSIGARIEKDLVYGARDSFQLRVRGKASIPLPWKFSLEPELSLSRQGFSTFRSDPINDPKNSPLRVDWETHVTAALKFPVTSILVAQAQYGFNRKLSNYVFENYFEHVVETGMNMQF